MRTRELARGTRHGLAAGAIASLALIAGAGMAAAAPVSTRATSAVVVKVVTRAPIGKMLATTAGRSLYIHPGGSCNTSCQQVWPPLLMPTGATVPKGAACLTTVAHGSRLQVRYQGQRLYTFVQDSGNSVKGNGVGGFLAAKVSTACP